MHLETLPQVVNYPIEAQNRGDESDNGSEDEEEEEDDDDEV